MYCQTFPTPKIAQRHGDGAQAARLYGEVLAIWSEFGFKQGVAEGLEALGAVAADEQQWERAGRVFGAAEALRETIGAALPSVDRADYDGAVAAVRVALGEAAEASWAEGRAMGLDQAIEHAHSGTP